MLAAVAAACSISAAPSTRPNIVWIMADDLGWGEVGTFPSTSPHGRIATPHLDRMASEGIRFTNAYAGYTVCAPSRTAFFTGRHSGNFAKYNLSGTEIPASQDVLTTAALLQKAGYTTGASGKIAPLLSPTSHGFDRFLGQIDQNDAHNMYPLRVDVQANASVSPGTQPLPLNSKEKNRKLCMADPESYNHTSDVFHDDAAAWLREVVEKGNPFFLYLSFTVPHAGGWSDVGLESGAPVPSDLGYANESWPDVEKDHAAAITYLDGYVGNILGMLQDLEVDGDTIVFFASDNGAHLEGGHSVAFFNSTGGLLGHKRSLYEGGVRSPTLVRWPGHIPAGAVSDTQWAFWDVLPTFAELAGLGPESLPPSIDGISIVDALLHGKQSVEHEYLYFTWNGAGSDVGRSGRSAGKSSGYSVRMGDWKGVVPFCSDKVGNKPSQNDTAAMQLYDLASDAFEQRDISKENAAQVEKMVAFIISQDLSCECFQC
eukprot:TRINITY_DN15581_c0_g1_i1.p1 TRINITY_DN15581_c0_g1~~TRINITY_DN15581_c0_g1_i1.p1  ORF type:complete len:506 (+),score=168.16 TRINITY_DN15581_c0_g1_i1:61-1518(+)